MEKANKRMESFVGRSNILVLASHSLDLIRRWCDKVVLLQEGCVTAFGPLNEVLGKYDPIPDAAAG
jgi:ABC-2 type transport system ATP-binding protein/lipopolysaccharide transport system ATP-binding protein